MKIPMYTKDGHPCGHREMPDDMARCASQLADFMRRNGVSKFNGLMLVESTEKPLAEKDA